MICGTNSGHHIMLDAEESCNTLGKAGQTVPSTLNFTLLYSQVCSIMKLRLKTIRNIILIIAVFSLVSFVLKHLSRILLV